MLKIIGTKEGRVFTCGKDGNLYEMIYQSEDRWFQKRCRKVNHTSSGLIAFIPSFLKFAQDDPLVDIALDSSRNILYTLSETKSSIQVYDLGEKGDIMTLVYNHSTILSEIEKSVPKLKKTRIVKIAAISRGESSKYNLVAITNSGVRIYFSANKNTFGFSPRPDTLNIVNIRFPPDPNVLAQQQTQSVTQYGGIDTVPSELFQYDNVHEVFYSRGVLLLANNPKEGRDDLIAIHLDSKKKRSLNVAGIAEKATLMEINGMIWVLDEQESQSSLCSIYRNGISPEGLQNELITQHFIPPRIILVFTNTGMQIFEKKRPIDQLYGLLQRSGGKDSHELKQFSDDFSDLQTCVMALMLASLNYSKDPNMQSWAARLFFHKAGRPEIPSNYQSPNIYFNPPSLNPSEITYSTGYSAIIQLLARYLRPLWNAPLMNQQSPDNLQFNKDQLEEVEGFLSSLKAFLDDNPQLQGQQENRSRDFVAQKRRMDYSYDEALKIEQQALKRIYKLLQRSLEATSFLSILSGPFFSDLVKSMTSPGRDLLNRMRFQDFVGQQDGIRIAKELVNALTYFQDQNVEAGKMSAMLRDKSPTFFTDSDRNRFKAEELLKSAKYVQGDTLDKMDLLEKSLELFVKAADDVPIKPACDEFKSLGFYSGSVKLALAHANAADPNQEGLSWILKGKQDSDLNGKQSFGRRIEYYQIILDTLNEFKNKSGSAEKLKEEELTQHRTEILNAATNSNDEAFHYVLYDWFVENSLATQLLQLNPSRYLENYLERNGESFASELLCRHYIKSENFAAASKILSQMATKSDPSLKLSNRIESLSRALSCATNGTSIDDDVIQGLEEQMEVAQIQMQIYNQLELLGKNRDDVREARNQLDSKLFNVTDLFNKFAKKFKLNECQLAILKCSGYNDSILIQKLWSQIIEEECNETLSFSPLSKKVELLGREFSPSDVFPSWFLVEELEKLNARSPQNAGEGGISWVFETMRRVGIPFGTLFEIYSSSLDSNCDKKTKHHLLVVMNNLIEQWVEFIRGISGRESFQSEVRQFESKRVDLFLQKKILEMQNHSEFSNLLARYISLKNDIFAK
eukprot:TRINITY_DN2818_c0_g1_i1.p1 TRINITY_DN2818_c0_g1~~TRINITY_DN2818_c0_g1_i1.p1  ORF type:complete len:1082 (+),score=248.95 TRINITY_DN2818_c0_g1_i1:838-4083(+)